MFRSETLLKNSGASIAPPARKASGAKSTANTGSRLRHTEDTPVPPKPVSIAQRLHTDHDEPTITNTTTTTTTGDFNSKSTYQDGNQDVEMDFSDFSDGIHIFIFSNIYLADYLKRFSI